MVKKLLTLTLSLLMTTFVMAQVTTSALSGKVTTNTKEAVIGATVQVVHEPFGTRYTAVTKTDGLFSIQGMRTGGPYSVTISYIGYKTKVYKGITLQLAETFHLNASISENANEIGEIVVSGKNSKFAAEKTGASTNISNAQILNTPTVSREITDFTRLSPYGGSGMK